MPARPRVEPIAARFRFESKFTGMVLGRDLAGLERQVYAFVAELRASGADEASVLTAFAEWLAWRADTYCREHGGLARIQPQMQSITRKLREAVRARSQSQAPAATLPCQLYAFLSALQMLRRLSGA